MQGYPENSTNTRELLSENDRERENLINIVYKFILLWADVSV